MASRLRTALEIEGPWPLLFERNTAGDLIVSNPYDETIFRIEAGDVPELVSWLRMAFPLTADIEIRPAPGGGTGPASHVGHSWWTPA